MKKLLILGLGVMLAGIFMGNTQIQAQPTAFIKIEAMSPQDLADAGLGTWRSSGLPNVGKGELVYMYGGEVGGEEVTAYLWSFDSVPVGSNAALDSTDKKWTTFRPDTTGHFVVKLMITTASGVHDTTVTINSALYVGVSGLPPSCQYCHGTNVPGWQETRHATKFTRDIDGAGTTNGAFYQASCLRCHTVGYNTDSTAVNGGFDDVIAESGWNAPDTLQPGNWDDIVANFPEVAQKANIQCEMCHGPGSEHSGDKANIALSLDAGVCGQCHDALTHHPKVLQWERSKHGEGVSFAAGRATCAGCHSGWGFIARMDAETNTALDKPPQDQQVGFQQTSCAVCHDPHSKKYEHQLRRVEDVTLLNGEVVSFGEVGRFCMNCHRSRHNAEEYAAEYHNRFGPHYNVQTDMLAGTNAVEFGLHIPSSNHRYYVPEVCVTCHMSETPGPGEPGQHQVGEHTWNMHWDGGTPDDPSDDVYNVSACRNCHGPINSFKDIIAKEDYDGDGVIEPTEDEVDGLMGELGKLLPPLGDPEVTVVSDYTPVQLKAAYNYLFVLEDKSHGFHNFMYTINLLETSRRALTVGDLSAGTIQEIADVPNDQGKQVRVVWSRFGGDGSSFFEFYSLWRRVDNGVANSLGKQVGKIQEFEAVVDNLNELEVGSRVLMDAELWDFAGTVPAAGLDYYSAIAPTLYDSTAADGAHWSVFVVSGHTRNPAIYAVSEPASGYSIDNLAPATPANVSALESSSGTDLSWDNAVDEDFKFFSVYRGTSSGFEATNPLATTTEASYIDSDVLVGTTYYYRVSSSDFSGNMSELSSEVSLVVTSVENINLAAIPDDYLLLQNYPNPFNPSTEIAFGLPTQDNVKITVFNVLGEHIKTLAQGTFSAGTHKVVWQADNDRGQQVGPGMYFYRLQTGSSVLTKKMMLIK